MGMEDMTMVDIKGGTKVTITRIILIVIKLIRVINIINRMENIKNKFQVS
jgi:hypothetical protein